MISSIYRHLFLELKRSSYWIDTVLMNIVKGMGLALVSLPFLLVSYVLDYVLDATIQKPLSLSFLTLAVCGLLLDFVLKVRFLKFGYRQYGPYLTLPIGRRRIVNYEVVKSLISVYNIYGVILTMPFFIRMVYIGRLSASLAVSYILFVFAVQLCVSLLARVSKSLSRVSFVVILSVFVAICVASIYYLMEVESLPSVLETIRSNSVVFFMLGGLLYVVYYIFTSLTIRRSMYGMYEGESGKIGSRMADVGLLRRTPILRIYLLALFRCKSHFYMLIICAIMLVALLLDISVFSTPQMKVFIMSLFVCGPAASFSLYAQIMSTSAEALSVSGLNTWKQLLWITFVCHVLWSLFATALLMFLTSEYLLCLYIYLISIGLVFYVISESNGYYKGRFDIFEQQGFGKQNFKFSVRYMGALYLIPTIWSIFYSSMASGTVSPQAFTLFSLLLSVPFIIFTKVGINRHAKVFLRNKYSYLKSVRR